jgi:hypothetical protein
MQYQCDERESEPSQSEEIFLKGRFDDKSLPIIKKYLSGYSPQFCEYNIVNLFCWGPIYDYRWFVYKKRLLIYDGKNNVLMFPAGPSLCPDDLYAVSHQMIYLGLSPNICLVSKSYLNRYPRVGNYYTIEKDRDAAEYVYITRMLIDLNTSKLHKKKNLVSQFHRRYPDHRLLSIDKRTKGAVESFAKDLLEAREPVTPSLKEEFDAMQKTFAFWDQLDLEGLVLCVENNIAAFTVFSRLNKDTFNVHFEKSNIAYKGAAQVINQETAKFLENRCEYINREQDLGIPGLRQAKLSYEPHRLVVPYLLKFKSNA